jgi:hypothetical protein
MFSRFKGVEANERHLGFWQGLLSNRIVCRAGGKKRVLLVTQSEDDADLKWQSTDAKVATAKFVAGGPPGELLVEITGHNAGGAVLTLYNGGAVVESVIVSVYGRRTVKVNFYRVNDGSEPAFALSSVGGVLRRVNALYKYQANVVFESHLVKNLSGAPDFAARAQPTGKLKAISDWLEARMAEFDRSTTNVNVFCVRKYGAIEGLPGQPAHIFGGTVGRTVIVEDVGGLDDTALLVGHELGHALAGEPGHSALPGSLMAEQPRLDSRHLYPQDVFKMRGAPA